MVVYEENKESFFFPTFQDPLFHNILRISSGKCATDCHQCELHCSARTENMTGIATDKDTE